MNKIVATKKRGWYTKEKMRTKLHWSPYPASICSIILGWIILSQFFDEELPVGCWILDLLAVQYCFILWHIGGYHVPRSLLPHDYLLCGGSCWYRIPKLHAQNPWGSTFKVWWSSAKRREMKAWFDILTAIVMCIDQRFCSETCPADLPLGSHLK